MTTETQKLRDNSPKLRRTLTGNPGGVPQHRQPHPLLEKRTPDMSGVSNTSSFEYDYLDGAAAIAQFLGPAWTERKVYHARETNALPVRRKSGLGLYAFRSELIASLLDPVTLTPQA